MDNTALSGAWCDTFLSSVVLRRDVVGRLVCTHSAVGCSASEYYCHCAMSVSFPRICNEIFAGAAAGLRNLIVLGWSYLGAFSLMIYTQRARSCASRLRAHLQPRIRRVRVNGTSESRCCRTLSVGNDLSSSSLLASEGKIITFLVRAHFAATHDRPALRCRRSETAG